MTKSTWGYLALLLGVCGIGVGADAHPAATASDWQANPESAYAAIMTQLQKLLHIHAQYQAAVSWTGWVIAAGGILVTLSQLFPGPTGKIVLLLWNLTAPKWLKQEDAKKDVLAQGFHSVAEIMKSLPVDCDLGCLLTKLQGELPDAVKQAYREWEKSGAAPVRPPSTAQLINTERIKAAAALSVAKEAAAIENPPSVATPSQPAVIPNIAG